MIPFGKETVTLVHRTEVVENSRRRVTYSVETLTGCSWRRTNQWIRIEQTLTPVETYVCRIPHTQTRPDPGDLLILGDVAVTVASGADFERIVEQYRKAGGAMVVSSVSDNARPGVPLPHWAARS